MLFNVKSNEDLFNKWDKIIKKASKVKTTSQGIIQNNAQYSRDDLARWHLSSLSEIQKIDQDFSDIVKELLALREETISYIRETAIKVVDK